MLADSSSAHSLKWIKGLVSRGVDLQLFSLYHEVESGLTDLEESGELVIHRGDRSYSGSYLDMRFIKRTKELKELIRNWNPDILHAHYASSYGLLGALSSFRPFVISTWGSDVFSFPKQNILFRWILRYSLAKADRICATSDALATEGLKYTQKLAKVIPFGLDTDWFSPADGGPIKSELTFGTVKRMKHIYGTDVLVKAFIRLNERFPNPAVRLKLVGGGPQEPQLKEWIEAAGLSDKVDFIGPVPHKEVLYHLRSMDVFCAFSREESFGVAALEAMSCEKAVILSDAPGFVEIVDNGKDGIIVAREDVDSASQAMEALLNDAQRRMDLGRLARIKVVERYNWSDNLDQMLTLYHELLTDR